MTRKRQPALPDGYSVWPTEDDERPGYEVSAGACPECRAAGEPCGRAADGRYATEEQATAAAWLWAAYFDAGDALGIHRKACDLDYEPW